LTKGKIGHLANCKIPQMADASGGFLLYTELEQRMRWAKRMQGGFDNILGDPVRSEVGRARWSSSLLQCPSGRGYQRSRASHKEGGLAAIVNKDRMFVIVFLVASILMGCIPSEVRGFSIYLLADEVPATELSFVDLNDLELQEEPILSGDDIIAYSRETHEIELTAEGYERIQQLFTLPGQVGGIPFVVCVGGERVYAGAFWTPASSVSFDGVVIWEPFDPDERVIRIELGYPTPESFTGEDPRSDPRVLQSLEAVGKLK
jgi:hypothetical protein